MPDKGTWIHGPTDKSSRFKCSLCGKIAHYPQANHKFTPGCIRILYQYCPYCGKPMQTIGQPPVKEGNWE